MNMAYKTPPQWIAHWCRTARSRSKEHRTPLPYANSPSPRMSWNQTCRFRRERSFTSVFVLENGKLQAVLDEAASAVSGTPENDGLKALQAQMKTLRADLEKLSADMKSEDKEVVSAAEKKYDEIDQR